MTCPTSTRVACWLPRQVRRRCVSSSRTDEFGLRTVIARVEAGDAVWVEAIVARVAEIIAPRHPDPTADEPGFTIRG